MRFGWRQPAPGITNIAAPNPAMNKDIPATLILSNA
jgi:hypothetical protein